LPAAIRSRRENELERLFGADQARQPLRAARARDDAQSDLWHPESRRWFGDAVVTGQRNLEAATEHSTVQGRNNRD
jgi:hypothetical protein